MKIKEFANIFSEITDRNLKTDERVIKIPDIYIDGIVRCIKFWRDNSNKNLATQKIREFLSNPSYDNGIVYEILAYLWFIESGVDIEYQPLIEKENSFKSKGAYNADGKLDGEILFDIKTFSFGQPRYAELQNALNDSLLKETKEQTKTTIGSEIGTTVGANNKDYYIMVTGNVNLSSKEMAEILEKKYDILVQLFNNNNRSYKDFIYKLPKYGLEIRAHHKEKGKINTFVGISEANSDEWAMNNEKQVLYHGSQFCRNSPYILVYPYDNVKNKYFYSSDDRIFYTFRTLVRRIFFNLSKCERYLNGFDGKAAGDIRVCEAIHKLTGILFIDVTNGFKDNNTMLFLNPNADNKMRGYQRSFFDNSGAIVHDFEYDNY